MSVIRNVLFFLFLQKKDIDFSHIDINVDATLDTLRKLKETPGVHFQGLKRFLEEETKEVANIQYSEVEVEQFMKHVSTVNHERTWLPQDL